MRVALVYDRVNKYGGAERVLQALNEIYPDAPLYTAVYNPKGASWAKIFPQVISSFVQRIPFASSHHEAYPWLMPLAFEAFDFETYDLVISITSEAAKGIITKPKTLHICYCLTPTRYLWSSYQSYQESLRYGVVASIARFLMPAVAAKLRIWDQIAAQRPDLFIAISKNVSRRIKKYYCRESEVIYPPVNLEKFRVENFNDQNLKKSQQGGGKIKRENLFLVVSRLVYYKRIDLIIEAFNQLGWPLKIIGDGTEKVSLNRLAKPNIEFLGQDLTDEELIGYYQRCRALIFAGEEDFGLVSIEAQACGRPVIAYRGGGLLETVEEGVSGKLFYPQTVEALMVALREFKDDDFKPENCRKNVERFSLEVFKEKFKNFVEGNLA